MTPVTPLVALQRRLTRAFVARQPVTAALSGLEEIPSTSGAKARTRLAERPPVTFTLCEPSDSGYSAPLVDERGSRRAIDFELVAEWGTDIREGDEFDHAGHRYRLVALLAQNDYETRALVTRVR